MSYVVGTKKRGRLRGRAEKNSGTRPTLSHACAFRQCCCECTGCGVCQCGTWGILCFFVARKAFHGVTQRKRVGSTPSWSVVEEDLSIFLLSLSSNPLLSSRFLLLTCLIQNCCPKMNFFISSLSFMCTFSFTGIFERSFLCSRSRTDGQYFASHNREDSEGRRADGQIRTLLHGRSNMFPRFLPCFGDEAPRGFPPRTKRSSAAERG